MGALFDGSHLQPDPGLCRYQQFGSGLHLRHVCRVDGDQRHGRLPHRPRRRHAHPAFEPKISIQSTENNYRHSGQIRLIQQQQQNTRGQRHF
jgi:hypothetical protein